MLVYDEESLIRLLETGQEPTGAIVESKLIGKARDQVDRLLGSLASDELAVIRRHFGLNGSDPESLEVIAQRFGLEEDEVDQIRVRALNKLREQGRYQIVASIMGESRAE